MYQLLKNLLNLKIYNINNSKNFYRIFPQSIYYMPRLNLVHDLKWRFNDLLVSIMEVEPEDQLSHPNWGFPIEVDDCDLPYKESFRHRELMIQSWDFINHRNQRIENVRIGKFIDRLIQNNIGKSFSRTYSYYCRKANKIQDKHYFFMQEFVDKKYDYQIDNEGLIQQPVYKKFYTFKPTITKESVRKSYEKNQAIKKRDRLLKKAQKEKQYSFLTKSEISIKENFLKK